MKANDIIFPWDDEMYESIGVDDVRRGVIENNLDIPNGSLVVSMMYGTGVVRHAPENAEAKFKISYTCGEIRYVDEWKKMSNGKYAITHKELKLD